MKQILLKQQISNHPLFGNIKRYVEVNGANIDGEYCQIVINASVKYYDENEQDLTGMFKSKLDWIVNNNDFTTIRNERGEPVRNPQYREAPSEGEDDRTPQEKEPYEKAPSFDYFFGIVKDENAPSLIKLLKNHIFLNDQIGFFDDLLNQTL